MQRSGRGARSKVLRRIPPHAMGPGKYPSSSPNAASSALQRSSTVRKTKTLRACRRDHLFAEHHHALPPRTGTLHLYEETQKEFEVQVYAHFFDDLAHNTNIFISNQSARHKRRTALRLRLNRLVAANALTGQLAVPRPIPRSEHLVDVVPARSQQGDISFMWIASGLVTIWMRNP